MRGGGRRAHGTDAGDARRRQCKLHAPSVVSEGLEFNEFRNRQIKYKKQHGRCDKTPERYPTRASLLWRPYDAEGISSAAPMRARRRRPNLEAQFLGVGVRRLSAAIRTPS